MFAIKNDAERHLWAGWLTFVVLASLLGDSLILVASIKYKAFKLHKLVVTIIQHLAVSDLLHSVGGVAPGIIAAIYNRSSPHKFIDYARYFIACYATISGTMLVSALTLGKLLLLKYPLKLGPMLKKHAHKFCAGICVICVSVPVLQIAIDKDDVIFDFRTYSNSYTQSSPLWKYILPVTAFLINIVPGVTVVVSTVLILREARKVVRRSQESLRWQGITTVVLTALVYIISFLPTTFYFIVEPFVRKDTEKPGSFHKGYFRFAYAVLQLSILSNFFIYSLTVTGFRSFLVTKFYEIFSVCVENPSNQGSAFLFLSIAHEP